MMQKCKTLARGRGDRLVQEFLYYINESTMKTHHRNLG